MTQKKDDGSQGRVLVSSHRARLQTMSASHVSNFLSACSACSAGASNSTAFCGFLTCVRQPFVFEFGVMAEIDQQTHFEAGGVEVVDHLGAVLVSQRGHRLDLDDDFVVAHEVRLVLLFQRPSFVRQRQRLLRDKEDALHFKFDLQAFLINSLQKPTAFLFVHLEAGADDFVCFVFVEEFLYRCHFSFHLSCPQNTQNDAEKRHRLAGAVFGLVPRCASSDQVCVAFSKFISACSVCSAGTFNFKRILWLITVFKQNASPTAVPSRTPTSASRNFSCGTAVVTTFVLPSNRLAAGSHFARIPRDSEGSAVRQR